MSSYKYKLTINCPKKEHNDIEHKEYYRISKNEQLQEVDFVPQYWAEPQRVKKFEMQNKVCDYQGLSCFATFEEAKNMSNRFSLGDYFYKGISLEKYATIKDIGNDTYPTHVNIYVYSDVNEIEDIEWNLENENK